MGLCHLSNSLDSDKVIFNVSDYVLSNDERRILLLGLEFGLPVFKLNYCKYFFHFEKLFSILNNYSIYDRIENSKSEFKLRVQSIASKFFYNFKSFKNMNPFFQKKDFSILKTLSKNNNIYVTRPDKSKGVVIMNRNDYCDKMLDILNDDTKFTTVDKPEKKLIIQLEDKFNETLRKYKNNGIIDKFFYEYCKTSGTVLGSLYGLPKTHKVNYPLRPILSACGTVSYKLSKYFVKLLSDLALGDYIVKNSKEFVQEITNFKCSGDVFMCSFDISSLYTNIPVSETIEIILDKIFIDANIKYHGMNRVEFRKLLEFICKETYFKFNDKIYKQIEGLPMGSPISPIAANIFLNHFEEIHLNTCPTEFKPLYYKRYLDDTFIVFNSEDQAENFFNFLNSKHDNINFTMEKEQQSCLSFLDVTVKKVNGSFTTSVFRKHTYSGLGTNYFSSIFYKYKLSSIKTLLNRAYELSSSYLSFHNEVQFLRNYFQSNCYPTKIYNSILRKFINDKYISKRECTTVNKELLYLGLPFIGVQTGKLVSELNAIVTKFYPQIQPKFYFRNSNSIGSYFKRNLKMPDIMSRTSVVYKYNCDCCQQSYIGSTVLQMFVRCARHSGISYRTGRPYNTKEYSSIRDHCSNTNHCFKFDNFSILTSCHSSESDLRLLETIFIKRLKPSLNKTLAAVPLNILE